MSREYRYHKGSQSSDECVEFDITSGGNYETTCVVGTYRLSIGIMSHPCGNGDDYTLSDSAALDVLKLIQKERNAVKYSGQLKTLDGWRGSGLNLGEYLAIGDSVNESLADEQLGCLPPHTHKRGYFQVGEPYNQMQDENGHWRSTYSTFVQNGPNWKYCGLCFTNDTVNRVDERDRVADAIKKIEERKKANV